jgi:hypothetical protein
MTDEMLMAYADGELNPLEAKRVEAAIAADPALAARVEAHRRLRATLADAFAGVPAEPLPERLRAPLETNVVQLRPRAAPSRPAWASLAAAMAASLLVGLGLGTQVPSGPIAEQGGALVARGSLASALDSQSSGAPGDTRILLSFQDRGGRFCRTFDSRAASGIACRDSGRWAVIRTRAGSAASAGEYRQANSPTAALFAEAQEMMAGEPLDAAAEATARERGWRP